MNRDTYRILIGLCEIAGYNTSLKKGFDELGIDSVFVELTDHPFQFGKNSLDNLLVRIIRYFGNKRTATKRSDWVRKVFWALLQQIFIVPLFLWSLWKFDVFIFIFGESFFRLHDLPLLKLFKKRIVFVFLGSETRPPYLNEKYAGGSPSTCRDLSSEFKRRVKRIERFADIMVNHPPAAHFHEKEFIQFMELGIPTAFAFGQSNLKRCQDRDDIRILHAPSYSAGKGTDLIRTAIQNLKANGRKITYVEIINRPNNEVLEELERCDFIVDELYSDAVMARFAAEAAFFAKPAVVGSYATVEDLGKLDDKSMPPVHRCRPEDIETAIEKMIVDEPYRLQLGKDAKEFLDRRWAPREVARRFLMVVEGNAPLSWYYDPRDIRYVHGWGMSEQRVRTVLREYITTFGVEALCLSDKPEVQRAFTEYISG